uniref:Immunoglobulin domain-containing protein n=1 Tax=Neovison vison TaxID=452646 RepID=A0A8C7AWE1_NEOVI
GTSKAGPSDPPTLFLLLLQNHVAWAVSSAVSGPLQGSLTVQCRYEPGWETYHKWWCQGAKWSDCHILVQTDGSEREVKSGRVSIVDHAEDLTFTVTLENLTADDAGKYRCGIATILQEEGLHGFLPDLFFQVHVSVSPSLGLLFRRKPLPVTVSSCRSLLSNVHFLLLILLKVPLLLMMLSAVLWVNRPQWTICGTHSRPDEDNMQPYLSIDILSRDTATHTRRGRTSGPLVPKNW